MRDADYNGWCRMGGEQVDVAYPVAYPPAVLPCPHCKRPLKIRRGGLRGRRQSYPHHYAAKIGARYANGGE